MNILAALDGPALFAQSNHASASPYFRPTGLPSLAPHLRLFRADVWTLRKWDGVSASFEACFKCLQRCWRPRHSELAPYIIDRPASATDKGAERGHDARCDWDRIGEMLPHARYQIVNASNCQGERVAASNNPAASASSCLALGAGLPSTGHAILPAHNNPAAEF